MQQRLSQPIQAGAIASHSRYRNQSPPTSYCPTPQPINQTPCKLYSRPSTFRQRPSAAVDSSRPDISRCFALSTNRKLWETVAKQRNRPFRSSSSRPPSRRRVDYKVHLRAVSLALFGESVARPVTSRICRWNTPEFLFWKIPVESIRAVSEVWARGRGWRGDLACSYSWHENSQQVVVTLRRTIVSASINWTV